jgi:copper homeostasis protein
MKKDIDRAKQAGAAGVVFGLLTPENKIDVEKYPNAGRIRLIRLPVTFHKAIDELGKSGRRCPYFSKKLTGIKANSDFGGESHSKRRRGNLTENAGRSRRKPHHFSGRKSD